MKGHQFYVHPVLFFPILFVALLSFFLLVADLAFERSSESTLCTCPCCEEGL